MNIRLKFMLTSLLVVLVPLYIISDYAVKAFNKFNSLVLEQEMIAQAHIVGGLYKDLISYSTPQGRDIIQTVLDTCEKKHGSHIQILSPSGSILAESAPALTASASNGLMQRAELLEAAAGRLGTRWELIRDLNKVVYYIALPVRQSTQVTAIVYVTHDTVDITRAILTVVNDQRLVTAIAAIMALMLSWFLSHSITRRLRLVTQAAVAVASGDAAVTVPVVGRDEVGQLGRAVRHMKDEIERRNRYNREFITTTMHELKMPLTAIKGAAELLEQGAVDKQEARDKFVGNIRYEADRLIRMVWELGELTRLDTEALHAQKTEIDYVRFIREAVERVELTLDSGHPAIRVSTPESPLMTVIIPGRIEQVLGNLIDNAVRYTPATGSITITIEARPGGIIETRIQDSGCGIEPGNLPHIFERFFTTEPKDKPKDHGSGLGLAVARAIVESHQGTIRVESVPGHGALFVFTLPLRQ
jgi:two-component system sensor histidine kinase ChvG